MASDADTPTAPTNNNVKMGNVALSVDNVCSGDGDGGGAKSDAILQDLDVLDLTDSLTKTLVHGELRGKEGSLRDSESLQELDQDDLAAILPDVSTSSSCNESHSLLSGLDSTDSQHNEQDQYGNVDDMICTRLVSDTLAAMVTDDHDVGEQRANGVPVSPSGGTDENNGSRVLGTVQSVYAKKLSMVGVENKSDNDHEMQQPGPNGGLTDHSTDHLDIRGEEGRDRAGRPESLKNNKADNKPAPSRHGLSHRSARTHSDRSDPLRNKASDKQKVGTSTCKSKPSRHKSKSDVGDDSGAGKGSHTDPHKHRPLSTVKSSRQSAIDEPTDRQHCVSVECLLRIDTESNVSPDSGIQSSSGSPNTPDSPPPLLPPSSQPVSELDSHTDSVHVPDEETSTHSKTLSLLQDATAGDGVETSEDVACHVKLKKNPSHVSGDGAETVDTTSTDVDPSSVSTCRNDHVTVTEYTTAMSGDACVSCVTCPEFDSKGTGKITQVNGATVKRAKEEKHSKISAKERKLKGERKPKRSVSASQMPGKEVSSDVTRQSVASDSLVVVTCDAENSGGNAMVDGEVPEDVDSLQGAHERLSTGKSSDTPVPSQVDVMDCNSMSSEDTPLAFIKKATWRTDPKDQDSSESCPAKRKKKPGRGRGKKLDTIPSESVEAATVPTETVTLKRGIRSSSVDKVKEHASASGGHVPRPGRPRKHPRLDAETVQRLVSQQRSRGLKSRCGRPRSRHSHSVTDSSRDAVSEGQQCETSPRTELGADCTSTQTVDWCDPLSHLQQQIKVAAPIVIEKPKRGRPKGTTKKKSRNVLHKPVRRTDYDELPRVSVKSKLGLVLGSNGVSRSRMPPAKATQCLSTGKADDDSACDSATQENPGRNKVMNIFEKFLKTPEPAKNSSLVEGSSDKRGMPEILDDVSRLCSGSPDGTGVSAGNETGVKRKRGRPRKVPLTDDQIAARLSTSNTYAQLRRVTAKARVNTTAPSGGERGRDRELDSLVQSVQNSIDSQFLPAEEELTGSDSNTPQEAESTQKPPSLSSAQSQGGGGSPQEGAADRVSQWSKIQDGVRRWKSAPKARKGKTHRASLKVFHRRRRRKRRKPKPVGDTVTESLNRDDRSSDDTSLPSLPKLTDMTASPSKETPPQHRANSWSGPCLSVEVDGASGSTARSGGYVSGEMVLDDDGSDAAPLGSMPTLSPNSTASMPEIPPRPPLLRLEDFMRRRRRRKLKYFKSKHRNIFDPIFLAEVDHLVQELDRLRIRESDMSPPFAVPEKVTLPAAFNLSWQLVKRKHHRDMHLRRMKPLGLKGVGLSRERGRRGFRRKSVTTEDAEECVDLVASEQCLPLKKRHKLMAATQLTGVVASAQVNPADNSRQPQLSSPPGLNEKRKVGRPRKHPLPIATVSPQKIQQPGE